jgi:hypothetical protein
MVRKGFGVLAARMGKLALGSTIALWFAWFFMPFFSFSLATPGRTVIKTLTFWELLGIYASPGTMPVAVSADGSLPTSHGLTSLLGILAITVPLAAPFLRHRRAKGL